jgi:UDP-N-acetylglucosamine diphosphorylase/glucosamine-1-phosphate N-acetyltransferase
MNYILFDDSRRDNLLPLTFLRPVADIRIGILTIREKWERYLQATTSTLTEDYLCKKHPLRKDTNNILINGSILPDARLVEAVTSLKPNQAIVIEDHILAIHLTSEEIDNVEEADYEEIRYDKPFTSIHNVWDIFEKNDEALRSDYTLITEGRISAQIDKGNRILGKENLFVEEDATILWSSLNATTGPVYIGKEAQIMEGSLIRGPFALCEHSVVKMGTKIYGPVTIGPHSKAGGEISKSVIFGYSNKSHDGFLGHSVIGEWCNLGAHTCNSNLKNDYSKVKAWSYSEQSFVETGLQFCGLIMGDHSKAAINTMFNTGSVAGVCTSIFGAGFQRNFIASFQKGGTSGFRNIDIDDALHAAELMYQRRGLQMSETDKEILRDVYEVSFKYRRTY